MRLAKKRLRWMRTAINQRSLQACWPWLLDSEFMGNKGAHKRIFAKFLIRMKPSYLNEDTTE